MRRSSLAFLAAAFASAAFAAGEQGSISVTGLRHTVDKSYRRMATGVALFDRLHALAPRAELRFKLLPRKPGTDMHGIELAVVGDSFETPLALSSDNTFTLQPDAKALKENASVRPNRRAGTMTWRAEVRTPGLPPGTRRLGDLRLECKVGMEAGLISHYPSLMQWVMGVAGDDPAVCDSPDSPYLFFSGRPLFAATLVSGSRRQTLAVGELYAGVTLGETTRADLPYCDCEALLDRAYSLPLGDTSWPDDTLVQLEYMDSAPSEDEKALQGFSRDEVRSIFGKARAARFDDGYELWSYRYGAIEWVVLFDPSGAVAKARLRTAPSA